MIRFNESHESMDIHSTSIELVAEKEQKIRQLVLSSMVGWIMNVGFIVFFLTSGRYLFPSETVMWLVIAGLLASQSFGTWMMFYTFSNRIIRLTMDRHGVFVMRQRDLGAGGSGAHLPIDPAGKMTASVFAHKGKETLYLTFFDPSGNKRRLHLDGHVFSNDALERLKQWVESRTSQQQTH